MKTHIKMSPAYCQPFCSGFMCWCRLHHQDEYVIETVPWLLMMTSSNGNIFRVTGPLCGESPVPVNSTHKGQWRGALMISLICVRINDWVNNREAVDLRATVVIMTSMWCHVPSNNIKCETKVSSSKNVVGTKERTTKKGGACLHVFNLDFLNEYIMRCMKLPILLTISHCN